jgi:thiamine pyrophosphokinase
VKPIPLIQHFDTVILAHGDFPTHPAALAALRSAACVVCCDGAIENLLQFGLEPSYIVGDLDSIAPALKRRFADRLHQETEQESNDLTKSVAFCQARGYRRLTILGATGKREDHTLGNISLLASYADSVQVQMLTDYGVLNAISATAAFSSFAGQQVSIFRASERVRITLGKLKYPLHGSPLAQLWMGSLNEALGAEFTVQVDEGKVVVFREYARQA